MKPVKWISSFIRDLNILARIKSLTTPNSIQFWNPHTIIQYIQSLPEIVDMGHQFGFSEITGKLYVTLIQVVKLSLWLKFGVSAPSGIPSHQITEYIINKWVNKAGLVRRSLNISCLLRGKECLGTSTWFSQSLDSLS